MFHSILFVRFLEFFLCVVALSPTITYGNPWLLKEARRLLIVMAGLDPVDTCTSIYFEYASTIISIFSDMGLHNQYADETKGVQGTPKDVEVQGLLCCHYTYKHHRISQCSRSSGQCLANIQACRPQLSSSLYWDGHRAGPAGSLCGRIGVLRFEIPSADSRHEGWFHDFSKIIPWGYHCQ